MVKQACIFTLIVLTFPITLINGQKCLNHYCLMGFSNSEIEKKLIQVDESNPLNSFLHSKDQRKPKITGGVKKIDSIIVNSISGFKDKLTFAYDGIGRIISYKAAGYLKDDTYLDYWQNNNIYDSLGNLVSVITTYWDGKKWDNDRREDYIYNSEGNVIVQLNQIWKDNTWENYFKINDVYGVEENLVISITEKWVDSVWINSYKTTTEYFLDSLKSSSLFQEWQNNKWEDKRFANIEYDNENRVTAITTYDWNGITWNSYLRMTANYFSSQFQIIKLVEFWDVSGWVNLYRNFESYATDNYFTRSVFELWTNDGWLQADGPIHLYNPDRFELHYLTHEMLVYYNESTNIKEEITKYLNEYKLIQNYPNPFNPSTTISYQIQSSNFVTLKVYDVIGNEVAVLVNEWQEPGRYNAQFTTSGKQLASGMYFYTLTAGNFIDTKKFILLK